MPTKQRTGSRRGRAGAHDVRRDEFTKVTNTLKTVNVTREEFIQAMNEIRENVRQLEIQFRRIAQIQGRRRRDQNDVGEADGRLDLATRTHITEHCLRSREVQIVLVSKLL